MTSLRTPSKKRREASLWLRFGTFVVLLLLLGGTCLILNRFTIRTKASLEVVQTEGGLVAYLPKGGTGAPSVADTLSVTTATGGRLRLVVAAVREEPDAWVLRMSDGRGGARFDSVAQGNSRLTGYFYTGRVRLISLVFRKFN